MKALLPWFYTLAASTMLMVGIASAQDAPKPDSNATVTIVTAGDISITKANGKTAVVINFVPWQGLDGRHAHHDFRPIFS